MQITQFITPDAVSNSANDVAFAQQPTSTLHCDALLGRIKAALKDQGWGVLRGFETSVDAFSQLMNRLCSKVTFDPARQNSSDNTQKVDSGTAAIGLHIENGNTPFVPEVVAFYCASSARVGSETTVCDGHALYQALSPEMRHLFSQTLMVSRTLPAPLWKRYAVNEHPDLQTEADVKEEHLEQILAFAPNLQGRLNQDGSLAYELQVQPIRSSVFSQKPAFANAILGPSFNYEPPKYQLENGVEIGTSLKAELAELAEQLTFDVPWQSGDILVLDNTRVMHGRRAIQDAQNRNILIGMGCA